MNHILMSRGILDAPHVYNLCRDLIKKHHKVVVVAFSFFEFQAPTLDAYQALYGIEGTYREKINMAFLPYGIDPSNIDFCHYYEDSKETLIKKILNADIIYLPGGAPDLFMKRLEEKEIIQTIKDQHNALIIGSSAGTMIQLKTYHISKDAEYHKFSYQPGLGLLEGFDVEVHYRRRNTQKSGLKKVYRDQHIPIYAIPDDGVVVIIDGTYYFERAYLIYNQKGIIPKDRRR